MQCLSLIVYQQEFLKIDLLGNVCLIVPQIIDFFIHLVAFVFCGCDLITKPNWNFDLGLVFSLGIVPII